MQHQVHGGDAEHGLVRVESCEQTAVEMVPLFGGHRRFILTANVFGGRDQESRGTAGRVAYRVVGRGCDELHHHLADVLRGAELAVLTGGGELAEHVLVEIALHVEILDVVLVKIVEIGDYLLQDERSRDVEDRIAHVHSESGVPLVGTFDRDHVSIRIEIRKTAVFHLLDRREDPVLDDVECVTGILVLEPAPTHGLTGFGLREDPGSGDAGSRFELFVLQLLLVERTDEYEIRQLLDDRQRVGQPSSPDRGPHGIDFVLDLSGNHDNLWYYKSCLV